MGILKMKRLRIFSVKSQRENILCELQMMGCVEIAEPDYVKNSASENIAPMFRRESFDTSARNRDFDALTNVLVLLDKYSPVKTKMYSPKPELKAEVLLDDTELEECLELAGTIEDMENRLQSITSQETRLKSEIELLFPWENLNIPVDFAGMGRTLALMGAIPVAAEGSVGKAISAVTAAAQVFNVFSDKKSAYILTICMREDKAAILGALRTFGFSAASFGEITGTAKENLRAAESRLRELAEEKTALVKGITAFGGQRDLIKRSLDRISVKIARAEVAESLLYTDAVFVLEGWIPTENESGLGRVLGRLDCAWELEEPTQEELERNDVPVKLKSNVFTRLRSAVSGRYAPPVRGSAAPNPLAALFFVLVYGVMLADMGYGILMLIVGMVIKIKTKSSGGTKNFAELLIVCGISATLLGALRGGCFGEFVPQIAKLVEPDTAFVGLPSLFVLPDAALVILAGVLAMALMHVITAPHRVEGDGMGVYFGDIPAYLTLLVLMLTGSFIARGFNVIALMSGNALLFVFVSLLGNTLNFGLNILGCFVCDWRLRYLGYFSKFFKAGRREFKPLMINTKYVNVAKD